MKNSKLYSLILLFALALLSIQCTTDPIPGADGVDGVDGVDGADGVDGVNGTTECAVCHNVGTNEAVHSSYLFSGHAKGTSFGYAGGRSSCAKCHSEEGYTDYWTYGPDGVTDYTGQHGINCKTCHGTHTTFDFEGEGLDYALRSLAPIELITDPSYIINYSGTSNNCAFCHQPRRTMVDNGSGFVAVSEHWGPHHGPQATLLEGIQGEEIAGMVDYPAAGTARHRTGSSCVSCHMGEPSGVVSGNHTWVPTDNGCTQCHTNGIPDELSDGFEEDMEALLAVLEDVGILHESANEDSGEMEVHPVEGEWPLTESQAAWNYLLIYEDASNGIHNPNYAKALIKNSLEAVSTN